MLAFTLFTPKEKRHRYFVPVVICLLVSTLLNSWSIWLSCTYYAKNRMIMHITGRIQKLRSKLGSITHDKAMYYVDKILEMIMEWTKYSTEERQPILEPSADVAEGGGSGTVSRAMQIASAAASAKRRFGHSYQTSVAFRTFVDVSFLLGMELLTPFGASSRSGSAIVSSYIQTFYDNYTFGMIQRHAYDMSYALRERSRRAPRIEE
jgi:hypothetical protein